MTIYNSFLHSRLFSSLSARILFFALAFVMGNSFAASQNNLSKSNAAYTLIPGSSRTDNRPVVFIIGDSTAKNGKGNGDSGQWGWGSFFSQFILPDKASVENHARGGCSSRTFITEGLWADVLSAIRPGDYLMIQFGHNDIGPLHSGRARGTIEGIGNKKRTVTIQPTGNTEVVYSYGHYLRQYIQQAKAAGAHVLVLSLTPDNNWINDSTIHRYTSTYAQWASAIARKEAADYIDANTIIADVYNKMGRTYVSRYMLKDGVHTTYTGALTNAQCIANAMLSLDSRWSSIVNRPAAQSPLRKRKLFIAGDSTAKTYNPDSTILRGWGQMIGHYLGDDFVVDNHAEGGRSTKLFLSEQRWKRIYDSIQAGDVVIIQFGHNDASTRPERHTPLATYEQNLIQMVNDTRIKGGVPVLATSIVMRTFNRSVLVDDRLKAYPAATRRVARDYNVKLIDAYTMTRDTILLLGNEESKKLYNWTAPGTDPHYPEGSHDDTHTNALGADTYAKLIAQCLLKIIK
ncbi:MAG: rhamnogalacturonan acetylesterase [Bacteroidales bacterium]|nr:rhamnogalacturonan acetylesterase [Bacteroidales bacterium]